MPEDTCKRNYGKGRSLWWDITGKTGNIRDYASINELICLSNMENINALFIQKGLPQSERLKELNQIALHQMEVLEDNNNLRYLK